ncbi:uncharacterized protein LOC124524319 [Lynx rufus]|uniref:uncharacterized protein LOC124524319 n=1 Tax=Lynx rufus TaxID=61384 RepID=UPI001F1236D9|nr:uncharacterized protein LOC124524319 [Lynx rufus]
MQGSAKPWGEDSRRHHVRGPASHPPPGRPRGRASPFGLRRGGVFTAPEKGRKPRGPDAPRSPLPSPGPSGKLRPCGVQWVPAVIEILSRAGDRAVKRKDKHFVIVQRWFQRGRTDKKQKYMGKRKAEAPQPFAEVARKGKASSRVPGSLGQSSEWTHYRLEATDSCPALWPGPCSPFTLSCGVATPPFLAASVNFFCPRAF